MDVFSWGSVHGTDFVGVVVVLWDKKRATQKLAQNAVLPWALQAWLARFLAIESSLAGCNRSFALTWLIIADN
jgi:hypothetical protein